ncbi:hypothetical protein V9K67_12675 [Paraflavisolibacter sp. H34]|uniref:hypothetical protein n=1 Tax=Huijunlia imazamoxiresistens TaxID=3127457 RepID=UPI0030179216
MRLKELRMPNLHKAPRRYGQLQQSLSSMIKDLTIQQRQLAGFMGDISERCYYAGWMQGLEYVLWDALLHGQRQYGHGTISQKEIKALEIFSNAANAWIVFDGEKEETAIDLQEWKKKFRQDIEQNPGLLKG